MALQTSGQISISDIKTEMSITTTNNSLAGGSTPVSTSLFGAAQSSLNKTAPHKISEFYGYTHLGGGPPPPPPGGSGGGSGGFGDP
jgi:hypothetical protein